MEFEIIENKLILDINQEEKKIDLEIKPIENKIDFNMSNYDDTEVRELIGENTEAIQELDNTKADRTELPTKTSDLINDSDYVSDNNYTHTDNNYTTLEKNKLANLENYDDTQVKQDITDLKTNKANRSEIPDVSQFITKSVDDLINYYLKSETYTKNEVNNLIGAIQQFHYEIVQALPSTGASNILYLVPRSTSETNNVYDEYVYANNSWEQIGSTEIDLSDYYTKTEVNTLLNGKQSLIDSLNKLSSDLVDDTNKTNKFVTEQDITNWNNKATKAEVNAVAARVQTVEDGLDDVIDYVDENMPTKLSDLQDDSTHRTVTDTEKTNWNNKSDFSGNYNDLSNKPTIPDELADLTDDSTHRVVTDTEKTTWNSKADAGFTGIITGTSSNPTDGASLPVGVYKASDNQNISYINLLMEDGTTKRQSVQKGGIVIRTAARLEIFATQNLMYQYDTTNEYFYPAENFIESNLRRDYEAEGGYASLGTVSPPNNIFITSPINTLEATINTGEIGHLRIIFSVEDGIAKGDFGLSLTDTDGNDLIFNNGALPKPVAGESWIFDFVGNRCNATLYKSTYLDRDRDEQILFLVRSNSNQIYYPNLDSKPSITVQSAKGSTDTGRPVVMEYSEPFLTSFQDVEYYGVPKFIPLDLSLYNTSTQANMLHPHSQLPDGNYWVKSPGRMWVAGESYMLVGKELIYKNGDILGINGGEYTSAYYSWDSTEDDYKGGFFTTYQDVMDAISEINYEPALTIVRQTTTTGTTTVNNGKWNKRTNPVNSMTLAMANLTEIPDTFKARVTAQTSATFTSFNISQRTAFTVYFAGWDCANGVLAGKPNAFYNIDYRADGRGNVVAMVTGYDVPTT